MFDKEYSFRGKHCDYVTKLTAVYDSNHHRIFATNYDVYAIAPVIGFLYQRKSEFDKTGGSTKIFPDKLLKEQENLLFNYRLIMLLETKHESDFNVRIDKAFRYFGTDSAAEDEALYESYVLGGVEILYEKIIMAAKTSEDYLKNLYDFLEEFDERYNQEINSDNIIDLCKLARG